MYVYRLRSLSHPTEIYIGVTGNLTRRLYEHKLGNISFTSNYAPWKFETYVWIEDSEKAFRFEKYLKSHSGRAFAAKHF